MGSDEYALSRSVIWTESNRPISLHSTLYLPLRWMWVKWRQLHKLSYLRQFQQSTPNKRNSSQQKLRMCCEHMRVDVKRCRPTHTRTRKSWSTQSLRTGRRTRPNRNTSSDEVLEKIWDQRWHEIYSSFIHGVFVILAVATGNGSWPGIESLVYLV